MLFHAKDQLRRWTITTCDALGSYRFGGFPRSFCSVSRMSGTIFDPSLLNWSLLILIAAHMSTYLYCMRLYTCNITKTMYSTYSTNLYKHSWGLCMGHHSAAFHMIHPIGNGKKHEHGLKGHTLRHYTVGNEQVALLTATKRKSASAFLCNIIQAGLCRVCNCFCECGQLIEVHKSFI